MPMCLLPPPFRTNEFPATLKRLFTREVIAHSPHVPRQTCLGFPKTAAPLWQHDASHDSQLAALRPVLPSLASHSPTDLVVHSPCYEPWNLAFPAPGPGWHTSRLYFVSECRNGHVEIYSILHPSSINVMNRHPHRREPPTASVTRTFGHSSTYPWCHRIPEDDGNETHE